MSRPYERHGQESKSYDYCEIGFFIHSLREAI
jgi:hypothetical protein